MFLYTLYICFYTVICYSWLSQFSLKCLKYSPLCYSIGFQFLWTRNIWGGYCYFHSSHLTEKQMKQRAVFTLFLFKYVCLFICIFCQLVTILEKLPLVYVCQHNLYWFYSQLLWMRSIPGKIIFQISPHLFPHTQTRTVLPDTLNILFNNISFFLLIPSSSVWVICIIFSFHS